MVVTAYHAWRMEQMARAEQQGARPATQPTPRPRQVEEWTEDGVRYVPAARDQEQLLPLSRWFE
jgi:hypothetical protein